MTAINGCLNTSAVFNAILSGIQNGELNALSIFPNPSEGLFTAQFAAGTVQFEVRDLMGKLVHSAGTNGKNKETIRLEPGIYSVVTKNSAGFNNGIEKVIVR